jgi:hypothetical protein
VKLDFLKYPYHQAIVMHEIPLSIGGGIGQSRTLMLLTAQGAPRRSERDGMAEGAEGDVRKEEYSRPELSRLAGVTLSEGEGESRLAKS